MSQETKPFHIIVAGGGLVGLNAAHIFQSLSSALSTTRAVQFTVLESHHAIAPFIGSLLLFYSSTVRVHDQLGLLPALRPLVDRTQKTINFRAGDGSLLGVDEGLTDLLERRHGHGFRVCHRPVFADCLYQELSDESKARVLLGKRVVDVEVQKDGVKVLCEDGTVVEGDMVIGADGVRSRVRSCMQRLKLAAERSKSGEDEKPKEEEEEEKVRDGSKSEESPYLAGFRIFFGNTPVLPGLSVETNWEGAHYGISTQILTGTKQAWWAVYEQLETPTRAHVRYTEDDKQRFLEKWGDLYMAPGYTLNDVMKYNLGKTGMINLEEGMVDTWTWNRIVLVGDAVRKVEPHAGLGFNQGMTDIVTIANKLYALLKSDAPTPTTEDLEKALSEYQDERLKAMPAIDRLCRRRARQVAWPNWKFRIYATWIMPYLPVAKAGTKYVIGPIVSKAPVLDWLEEHNLPEHEVEYEHFGLRKVDGISKSVAVKRSSALPVGTAVGILTVMGAVGWRYWRL